MDLLGNLKKLLGIQGPQNAQPIAQRIQSQAVARQPMQPEAPDITVDPTGRIPYSARTPELARLGNQYVANPTDSRFLGVDPAQFGFPADELGRNFNNITPGYQAAAQNYERNISSNTNSPYIVGNGAIDPANFGYSADGPVARQRPGLSTFDQLLRRR